MRAREGVSGRLRNDTEVNETAVIPLGSEVAEVGQTSVPNGPRKLRSVKTTAEDRHVGGCIAFPVELRRNITRVDPAN